jgi:methionyl-tRNA formyltransferase
MKETYMIDYPRLIYAGDRKISVEVLIWLREQKVNPIALLTPPLEKASHADKLRGICSHISDDYVFNTNNLADEKIIKTFKELEPDLILSIHYPYIIPKEIIDIPKKGVVNLHPSYLPYNRGWHTPSWSILEDSPCGATLHFVDEDVDSGDIISQKKSYILPSDTAHSLYERILELELQLFKESWHKLITGKYERKKQSYNEGTTHFAKDLFSEKVQKIELDKKYFASELIKKMRALTTNKIEEAAYFEVDNKVYRIQINIVEESILE